MGNCLSVLPQAIPAKLKEIDQWVLWRDERNRKMPRQRSGAPASVSDSSTWSSFEKVMNTYLGGGYSGIGFVFTKDDPFVGIDLDGCRHPREGLAPWAQTIVDHIGSYTEISPSGHGIHIIVRGESPFPSGRKIDLSSQQGSEGGKPAAIEVYDHGRYFAVTGQLLPGRAG